MWRSLLSVAVSVVCLLAAASCSDDASQDKDAKRSERGRRASAVPDQRGGADEQLLVEVRVVEIVKMPEQTWKNFEAMKCVVTDPLDSKVETGQQINVVIPEGNITGKKFRRLAGDVKVFEPGTVYRLLITEVLPIGWDAIKDDFEDIRLGFVACLKAERVSSE